MAPSPALARSLVKTSSRIPELDGFRGLAILLVVTGHILSFTFHFLPDVGRRMGEAGVLLFFVLSGYLITGLLRDEAVRGGTICLKAFYLRRARRLLPALAVFLAVIAVLRWRGVITDVTNRDFVAAIFYVRNILVGKGISTEHLWSLSLEEQFYTIWPFLFLWLGLKRMLRVAIGISILTMVWREVAISLHLWAQTPAVFYLRPWFRFDAIAVGCCLALVALPTAPKLSLVFSAAALVGWCSYRQDSSPAFITVQTILAASLLFSVVKGGPLVRSLFSFGWLRWLGGISYSLYLWQQIFLVSTAKLGILGRFPWNLLAAFASAILSRRFIEEPFLKWRRRSASPIRTSYKVTEGQPSAT